VGRWGGGSRWGWAVGCPARRLGPPGGGTGAAFCGAPGAVLPMGWAGERVGGGPAGLRSGRGRSSRGWGSRGVIGYSGRLTHASNTTTPPARTTMPIPGRTRPLTAIVIARRTKGTTASQQNGSGEPNLAGPGSIRSSSFIHKLAFWASVGQQVQREIGTSAPPAHPFHGLELGHRGVRRPISGLDHLNLAMPTSSSGQA
jgi:hypothetical protein